MCLARLLFPGSPLVLIQEIIRRLDFLSLSITCTLHTGVVQVSSNFGVPLRPLIRLYGCAPSGPYSFQNRPRGFNGFRAPLIGCYEMCKG